MKKIFFVFLLALTSCMPNYERAAVQQDYSQAPLMELPVSRVSIKSDVGDMEPLPHVEKTMKMTPERQLKSWATIRLRPNYQTENKAEFVIRKASMIRNDEPEASLFTYNNYKYTLKDAITLASKDDNGKVLRSVDLEGFLSRKLPKKASEDQRNNMFTLMLQDLEKSLDQQMPEQIRQNLLDQ